MKQRYNRLFEIIATFDKEPSSIQTLEGASKSLIEIIKFLIENEGFEPVDILSKAEVIIAEKANEDLS